MKPKLNERTDQCFFFLHGLGRLQGTICDLPGKREAAIAGNTQPQCKTRAQSKKEQITEYQIGSVF